jgi:hypothetical protein
MEEFNNKRQEKINFEDAMEKLSDIINEMFADTDMTVHITIGQDKDQKEECKCKPKRKIKKPEELTIGEQYVLHLLKQNKFSQREMNFDSILSTIIDTPIVQFIAETHLNNVDEKVQSQTRDLISDIISSIMLVDFSKLIEILPEDKCC